MNASTLSPFLLPRRTKKLKELFLALEEVGLKVFEIRWKLPGCRARPTRFTSRNGKKLGLNYERVGELTLIDFTENETDVVPF